MIEKLKALHNPEDFHQKYFVDPKYWLQDANGRLNTLRPKPRSRCLDLGCAVPYFGYAAETCGHTVINVDVYTESLAKASEILNCDFIPHEIKPHQAIPPSVKGCFDLITMFGVNLRGCTTEEHRMVFSEAVSRLAPHGKFVVAPNYTWLDDIILESDWWRPCPVHISGNWVTIHYEL